VEDAYQDTLNPARRYGRNYYTRYDYEGVESDKADKVMSLLESKMVRYFVDQRKDKLVRDAFSCSASIRTRRTRS